MLGGSPTSIHRILTPTKVASSYARRRKPRPLTISSPSHALCLPSHVQELLSLSPLQRDPTPPLTKMTTTSTPPSYTSPLLARLATMCLSHRPSPTLEQTQFTLSALSTPPDPSLLQTSIVYEDTSSPNPNT